MDILAARKKAAERAREQKIKEQQEAATAAEQQPAAPPEPPRQPEAALAEPSGALATAAGPDVPAGPEQDQPPVLPEAGEKAEPQVQELEMLSFRLGAEEYAVLVEDVKEVLKNRDLTSVPNAPDYVLGVTSLRGPILPVIDLCTRLGFPAGLRDEKSRILVLSLNDEDTGIVVDRVTGVVRIHPDAIRPVPDTIERGAEFLKGIARKNDKLYILLDVEKALGV